MVENESKEFWIEKTNLPWLLLLLARIVNCKVDSSDLDVILYELTATSKEKGLWATAQLIGETTIDLQLAKDLENTDIIFIQLSFEKEASRAIDLCIMVVQDFFLDHKHHNYDLVIYE